MVFTFTIKHTTHGCTVTFTTPRGRTETRKFRNGYAFARTSADAWISLKISQTKFHKPDGAPDPEFKIIQLETE